MNTLIISFAGHPCLITIIMIFIQKIQCDVTRCCTEGSVIDTSINNFSCIYSLSNLTNWELYNTFEVTSIPTCQDNILQYLSNTEKYFELNGCIDKSSSDQFVAITCSDDPRTSVQIVNKCCPIGKSYDFSTRSCVENENAHENFKVIFNDSAVAVVLQNFVPICSYDDVYVEYFSMDHNIQLSRQNLKVNGDVISSDKFCMEDLVNIDTNEPRVEIIVRSCRPKSLCNKIPCMRRCCKADEILIYPYKCEPHPQNMNLQPIFYDLNFPIHKNPQKKTYLKEYGILHSWKCNSVFRLDPENGIDEIYYLHKDGKLHMVDLEPYDQDNYCIENTLTGNNSIEAHAFLCHGSIENFIQPKKFSYYPYGISISCVFLSLTAIVYILVPRLLNLHGKTLVCYVLSVLAAYITLAALHFNKSTRSEFCYEVAYFLLYCFLAVFTWQTVMCCDIWLTFCSLRSSFVMRHNRRNRLKFVYYSMYAWLMPLCWVLFTLYAEKKKPFADAWNPKFAETSCFFADYLNWRSHFLFLLLPTGIHVIANFILFIITAIHCSRVKSDIHRMQTNSDNSHTSMTHKKFLISRAIFLMNLKLFTVMGISWLLEIISTFVKIEAVEYILDTYNIFLGVFIFFIFVFKRKVLYELKCRFGLHRKHVGSITPRSTIVTQTANISMHSLKDIRYASDKNLPLLTASSAKLQVPSISK